MPEGWDAPVARIVMGVVQMDWVKAPPCALSRADAAGGQHWKGESRCLGGLIMADWLSRSAVPKAEVMMPGRQPLGRDVASELRVKPRSWCKG